MKYVIIGTAGHVDHGKSALIKGLTGVETDRLKEEKLRGISIDLGFASLALSEDITAGIVDVPGHERFLKNMLAGTGGIDMAMLVVAADEGVMPQTREHLAMLHLYGVRHGVVAVNKIDKVESDWLDLVEEDIRIALAGTFLADAPFCRVSAVTGQGVAELKAVLWEESKKTPARDRKSPFRMWIDRAFTAHGFGAVITGSILSGTVRTGDALTVYPAGLSVRVRGLESHGDKTEILYGGQRAAINITGADLADLGRSMFLSAPDRGETDTNWDMAIHWHGEPVVSGTRVRLHTGTGEYIGRVYSFKNKPQEYMRLLLEEPMGAGAGDRGILRLYSPQNLLAGVMLIGVSKRSRRMSEERESLAKALEAGTVKDIVTALLKDSRQFLTIEDLRRKAGYRGDRELAEAVTSLISSKDAVNMGNYYTVQERLEKMTATITKQLHELHRQHPDKPGISREIVKQQLALEDKAFDYLLASWLKDGKFAVLGGDLALPHHAEDYQLKQGDLVQKAETAFADIGIVSIDGALVSEKFNVPADRSQKIFEALVKGGQLVRMGEICLYKIAVQEAINHMEKHFKDKPTITVAELRDMLQTSRKIALPLMEYLDLHKYTIRSGDTRRPGPKLKK